MAFVFRSRINPYSVPPTPGPSFYHPQTQSNNQQQLPAPFNQTSPRKIWKENPIPGPGSYNIESKLQNGKQIMQYRGNILCLEKSVNSSNFKSHSKRFREKPVISPGPGEYNCPQPQWQRKKTPIKQQNNLSKYLFINHHERCTQKLEKIQIGTQEASQPKEKQLNDGKKAQKKFVPFSSSAERISKIRPQTSLGPGSYQIFKPDKSKILKTRQKSSYSLAKFKKVNPSECEQINQKIDKSQQMLRKLKDEEELNAVYKKGFNARKQQFFGSSVSRFLKTEIINTPGPGAYSLNTEKPKSISKQKFKPAFGRSANPQIVYQKIISPFAPVILPEKKGTSQKKHKKQNWNFGSSQPRFLSKQIKPKHSNQGNNDIYLGKSQIKIANNRQYFKKYSNKIKKCEKANQKKSPQKQNIDRPLCYAPWVNTIESKSGYKTQIKAPFFSQVSRFNDLTNQFNLFEDILAKNETKPSKQQEKKFDNQRKLNGIMNSKNPRFIYKNPANEVSPCSYNPNKLSKKEYNKLFL